MMDATYSVRGMTCDGCAKSVKGALERRAPGLEVEVSLETEEVRVRGAHDEEAIKDAIEDAGFDFGGAK